MESWDGCSKRTANTNLSVMTRCLAKTLVTIQPNGQNLSRTALGWIIIGESGVYVRHCLAYGKTDCSRCVRISRSKSDSKNSDRWSTAVPNNKDPMARNAQAQSYTNLLTWTDFEERGSFFLPVYICFQMDLWSKRTMCSRNTLSGREQFRKNYLVVRRTYVIRTRDSIENVWPIVLFHVSAYTIWLLLSSHVSVA